MKDDLRPLSLTFSRVRKGILKYAMRNDAAAAPVQRHIFIFILLGSLSQFSFSLVQAFLLFRLFHYLSTQQAPYLKPKSSQLAALLQASKWQQTVIDTALPVISPVGLPRLLYDGQADLAGSDTERDVNTEDPLRVTAEGSS